MDKKKAIKEKDSKNLINGAREGDNISTLRDILFGNKIEEYEKRFKELEERMNHEMTGIREEVNRLYNTLEQFLKNEQKNLSERLRDEQDERVTAERRIHEDMDSMSKKFMAHKEENADAHSDLRQLLLEQHKKLSDEAQQLKRELTAAIEKKSSHLDDKKVNRLALAHMLTEMAAQLSLEAENSAEQSEQSGAALLKDD